MIRHALAHLLHAVADRIETEPLEPEIQYVYVYSAPPATTVQPWPMQWWQSPTTCTSGTSVN
jgi:hypothetical protein